MLFRSLCLPLGMRLRARVSARVASRRADTLSARHQVVSTSLNRMQGCMVAWCVVRFAPFFPLQRVVQKEKRHFSTQMSDPVLARRVLLGCRAIRRDSHKEVNLNLISVMKISIKSARCPVSAAESWDDLNHLMMTTRATAMMCSHHE